MVCKLPIFYVDQIILQFRSINCNLDFIIYLNTLAVLVGQKRSLEKLIEIRKFIFAGIEAAKLPLEKGGTFTENSMLQNSELFSVHYCCFSVCK